MTPWDLIVWALAGAAAIVIVGIPSVLLLVAVSAARRKL